jgi:hypothetical protein
MKASSAKIKAIDSVGKQYSRLTVLAVYYLDFGYPSKRCFFYCICECGNTAMPDMGAVRSGATQSCGCFLKEQVRKHGFARHKNTEELRLYQIWSGIKQRCLNENQKNYFRYGGKGVAICNEWVESFETFLADMGPRPDKTYSIDRIDNSKGYNAENCRWATKVEQAQNTSFNINVTFGSATRSLSYWCTMFAIDHGTVLSRVNRGKPPVSFQEALTRPVLLRAKRPSKKPNIWTSRAQMQP